MSELPMIKAAALIQFLKSRGFEQVRQRGSHKFFRHPDGRTATVPDHKGEDLGRGIIRKILKDVDESEENLIKWLDKK